MSKSKKQFQGVGRRKSAVARVYISEGSGKISVNGRPFEAYFVLETHRMMILKTLEMVDMLNRFDVVVTMTGGGLTGQAGAMVLGLARATVAYDEEGLSEEELQKRADSNVQTFRKIYRRNEVELKYSRLTRDPRVVERKKVGQPKARRKKQFSKR